MNPIVVDFSRLFAVEVASRRHLVRLQNSTRVSGNDKLIRIVAILARLFGVDRLERIVLDRISVAVFQLASSPIDAVLISDLVERSQALFTWFTFVIEINENY